MSDKQQIAESIEERLAKELSQKKFLEDEGLKIASPEALGGTIMNVVWEQFMIQLASTTGMEYKDANGNLLYNISSEDLYLTPEDFEQGILPSRNPKLEVIEKRYETYAQSFARDESGQVVHKIDRTGTEQKVLVKDARAPFDKGRPSGSKTVHKDHTISAAEILRDPEINAFVDREAQIAFANSEVNLIDLDSAANESKGDLPMSAWLETERRVPGSDRPLKPDERFNIDKEACLENDQQARAKKDELVEQGKQELDHAADMVRKAEIKKVAGTALKAAFIRLLAELIKEITRGFIMWLRLAKHTIDTLIEYIKQAILSFIKKLKNQIMNATQSVLTAIATAIIGPIVGMIMKIWTMLKTGWKSVKEAIKYVNSAREMNTPYAEIVVKTGEIVITGLCGIGAIVLGEAISAALSSIPGFAFEIPSVGSFASIMGIFAGATVSGIIGAIVINRIEKLYEEQQRAANREKRLDNNSRILSAQNEILGTQIAQAEQTDMARRETLAQNEEEAEKLLQSLNALMSGNTILE